MAFMSCEDISKHASAFPNYPEPLANGSYKMDINGDKAIESLDCDMEIDGGVWTGFSVEEAFVYLNGSGDGAFDSVDSNGTITKEMINSDPTKTDYGKPFSSSMSWNKSMATYQYNLTTPFRYRAFYLKDFKAYLYFNVSDYDWVYLACKDLRDDTCHQWFSWNEGVSLYGFDIFLGWPDADPVASFARNRSGKGLSDINFNKGAEHPINFFPDDKTPVKIYERSTESYNQFRIGWGGSKIYPWYSGKIFFR